MRELLIERLQIVFGRIFPAFLLLLKEIEINYPPEEFGDYSTNLALKLAKKVNKNPREIAELIKSELEKDDAENDEKIFSQIEVAGAGFLNFNLSSEARGREIEKIKKFIWILSVPIPPVRFIWAMVVGDRWAMCWRIF